MTYFKVHLAVSVLLAFAMLSHALQANQPEEQVDQEDWRPNQTNPIIGLALAPTRSDLDILKSKVQEAKDIKAELIKNVSNHLMKDCEGEDYNVYSENQSIAAAQKHPSVVNATFKLAKAKADLANGRYWYYLEKKRQKELPSRVLKVQEQANELHKIRLQAEENATKAKQIADTAEAKYSEEMKPFREALERQRYEDRLRASQEIAIARQVSEKAAQARKQLAVKKKADEMIGMARQAYNEMRKKVTLAATKSIGQQEEEIQKEMVEKTKAVVDEAKKYKTAKAKAKKLKLQSARSAMSAQYAEEKAMSAKMAYVNVLKQIRQLEDGEYAGVTASSS